LVGFSRPRSVPSVCLIPCIHSCTERQSRIHDDSGKPDVYHRPLASAVLDDLVDDERVVLGPQAVDHRVPGLEPTGDLVWLLVRDAVSAACP
jgi:hypothetical protein